MGLETGALLAIGAGVSAAAGAGTSVYSAVQQNAAAKKQKGEAAKVASVNATQVRDQAAVERQKTLRRSAQIRGRLRLAGAEAGLGDLSSLDLLDQQNDLDTGVNLDILDRNEATGRARIGSELSSELQRLSSRYRNEVLAGFEGGLSGAGTGLQIGTGVQQLLS